MPTLNVNLPSGLVIYKDDLNLTSGAFPTSSLIKKGWMYRVTLDDPTTEVTIGEETYYPGSVVMAIADNPGNDPDNWLKLK